MCSRLVLNGLLTLYHVQLVCSTERHLSTVVNHILRYLSLDGGHHVILFPDTTVHTHLKSTSISWGPNVDPTSQVCCQAALPYSVQACFFCQHTPNCGCICAL